MNINELLTGATIGQRRWVLARLSAKSDAEAARMAGVHPVTVCTWPNKRQLDDAVVTLLGDSIEAALSIILDSVPEAARVKVAGLQSRREPVKQSAASEILDRALGKATQRQEVQIRGGLRVEVVEEIVDAASGGAGEDTALHDPGGVPAQ